MSLKEEIRKFRLKQIKRDSLPKDWDPDHLMWRWQDVKDFIKHLQKSGQFRLKADRVLTIVDQWQDGTRTCAACKGTGSPQNNDRYHCSRCGGRGCFDETRDDLKKRLKDSGLLS